MLEDWGSDFSALRLVPSQGGEPGFLASGSEMRGGLCRVCREELKGLGLQKVRAPSRSCQGVQGPARSEVTPPKSQVQLPPGATWAQRL